LPFLAHRTNSRAYATVLRLSLRRPSVTLCIVAKRCVLEQKLLLRAYRHFVARIGTKINDLDLCLEVISRSSQPLRYIRRWISRKPL